MTRTLVSHLDLPDEIARTIEQQPHSTIEPLAVPMDPRVRQAIESLTASEGQQRIELRETLGEGGMGIVRLATQRAIGRSVAVKTLKDSAVDDVAVLRLLREGWVTGALEHPNIVPVYDISVDARGAPVLVLKKIDGTAWSDLIVAPARLTKLFNVEDAIEAHLRITLQVCRALEFAHSRGIIHRDIKPENVMVGSFGEVYLLDWGIAVALHQTEDPRLPTVRDSVGLAGTLPYMAPEMLEQPPLISAQTDVYLLGGTLFEALTGAAPHAASTVMAMVHHIVLGDVKTDTIGDRELAKICGDALKHAVEDRTQSVAEFRDQIEKYLRFREPRALLRQAETTVAEVLALAASPVPDEPARRTQMYALYNAARFALLRVLRSGIASDAPQRTLDQLCMCVAEHELRAGDPAAAERVLAEWSTAPMEIRARVDDALRLVLARQQQLEDLKREHDPGLGGVRRWRSGLAIGSTWVLLPLCTIRPGETWPALYVFPLLQVLGFLVFSVRARQHGVSNQHNRHLIAHATVTMLSQLFLTAFLQHMGASVAHAFVGLFVMWGMGTALIAVWVHRYYWLAVLGFIGGFVVSVWDNSLRGIAASLANAVLIGIVLYLWHPRTSQTTDKS